MEYLCILISEKQSENSKHSFFEMLQYDIIRINNIYMTDVF